VGFKTSLQIESLAARAHDVLKLIPSLRNLLRPVNRLPPEILSCIARCSLDENSVDVKSIIPFTHVCRYWRESIISTPGNWTLISNERIGLTLLSLERCKAAPLELSINMLQVRRNPGFSVIITPYIQNIETLYIDSVSPNELAQALPTPLRPMPNLRSLSISGNPGWDWSIDPFGPLTSLTPALTHLSVRHAPLCPSFLHLRALTDLILHNYNLDLHLDTLLDFLEEKRSLERITLRIQFKEPSLRDSMRRVAILNQLRRLSIYSIDAMDSKALISSVALPRGAHLEIILYDRNVGANAVLSLVSMAHLSNLQSPTHMEYNSDESTIQLLGPNGSFSFTNCCGLGDPFAELPLPSLTNIRTFCFTGRGLGVWKSFDDPIVFPPSSLPALATFSIKCEVTVSHLFSALFSDPSSSPSLGVLAFLNCNLGEDFMDALTRFASDRKRTTSAWLHRVVIVSSEGKFPRVASICGLEKHVSAVDVWAGEKLPTDLI